MARVVLLTGGNIGEVRENLRRAEMAVRERIGKVTATSQVKESEAWGFECADRFLNQVLVVETRLEPHKVLDRAQEIEKELGRMRNKSDGYESRTVDIDILYYDDMEIEDERLTVPHPLIGEREFVLEPLAEVMPEYVDPATGLSVAEMLDRIKKR